MQHDQLPTEHQPTFGATVTILFSDIRGFTEFTDAHGDAAAYRMVRQHNALIEEQVAQFGGQVVKTAGDSWMVSFTGARMALNCAIGMQRVITGSTDFDDSGQRLQIGIGVNTGEPVREAGDFFGSTVNLAARICAAAGPGQILLSETVRQLVGKLEQAEFVDRGLHQVKGFREPQHLYELDWQGLAAPQTESDSSSSGAPEPLPRRIAPARRRRFLFFAAAVLAVVLVCAAGAYALVSRSAASSLAAADDFNDLSKALFLDNQQGTVRSGSEQAAWKYQYQSGALVVEVFSPSPATSGQPALGPKIEARGEFRQNIAVEVSASATRSAQQAEYGVDYDLPGGVTYRFVIIPASTQYFLFMVSGAAPRTLASGRTNVIQSGAAANRLRYEVRGNAMQLSINGNDINVARDPGLSARPAGVGVHVAVAGQPAEGAVEVHFRNFKVYTLP